jgi:hypothetical protein
MPRTEDDYTFEIITNEIRLALDPEDPVARVLLNAAIHRIPQIEMASAIGISPTTYRSWETLCPVLVGAVADQVIALNQWFAIGVGAHTDVRGMVKAVFGLGIQPTVADNTRSTSGGTTT